MKKRFLTTLTALLCVTGVMTAFPAAAEVSPDVQEMYDRYSEYAVETEDFTYRPFGEDVFLQSDAVKADLMVLGVFGNTVWVTEVRDTLPEYPNYGGIGTLHYKEEYITGLDGKALRPGDLLQADGGLFVVEIFPGCYHSEEGGFTYAGNGVDIFGDAFQDVIRNQLLVLIEQYKQCRNGDIDKEICSEFSVLLSALDGPTSGDVDVNNTIDTSDASAVLQDIADAMMDSSQLSAPQFKAADVNGDGVLTMDDASILLQYIAAKLMDDSVQLSDFT